MIAVEILVTDISIGPFRECFVQPHLFDPSRTVGQSLTKWCDDWPHTTQPGGVWGSFFFFDEGSSPGKEDDPRFRAGPGIGALIETPLLITLLFEVEFRVPDIDEEECTCLLSFEGGSAIEGILSRR